MKKLLFLILSTLMMSGIATAQAKLYLPYFEVIGLNQDYQRSLTRLFKTYIEKENRYSVVLGSLPADNTYTLDQSNVKANAAAASADYYFIGEVNRLEDLYIITASMYETKTGAKIWSDVLKGLYADDMDPILSRIAQAMGTDKKAAEEGDIYNVSEYESEELNQEYAHMAVGLSIGGIYSFFDNIDENFSGGLSGMLTYDTRKLIIDARGDFYFTGDPRVYFLSIDGLYPFSNKRNTPFVLGGLGLGGQSIPNDEYNEDEFLLFKPRHSNGGMLLFLGGGYLINRTSNVNIRLGGRGMIPLFKVDSQTAPGIILDVTISMG